MLAINPYLNFNGKCEEAFNFYKSVFGGEFTDINRFKEMPPGSGIPEAESDWILHIELPIGEGYALMGSDSPSSMGAVTQGNNHHISIHTDNSEETDRLFNGLSAGGQVTMPLQDTYWGARFGMFVDQFGIHWMINQQIGAQN